MDMHDLGDPSWRQTTGTFYDATGQSDSPAASSSAHARSLDGNDEYLGSICPDLSNWDEEKRALALRLSNLSAAIERHFTGQQIGNNSDPIVPSIGTPPAEPLDVPEATSSSLLDEERSTAQRGGVMPAMTASMGVAEDNLILERIDSETDTDDEAEQDYDDELGAALQAAEEQEDLSLHSPWLELGTPRATFQRKFNTPRHHGIYRTISKSFQCSSSTTTLNSTPDDVISYRKRIVGKRTPASLSASSPSPRSDRLRDTFPRVSATSTQSPGPATGRGHRPNPVQAVRRARRTRPSVVRRGGPFQNSATASSSRDWRRQLNCTPSFLSGHFIKRRRTVNGSNDIMATLSDSEAGVFALRSRIPNYLSCLCS